MKMIPVEVVQRLSEKFGDANLAVTVVIQILNDEHTIGFTAYGCDRESSEISGLLGEFILMKLRELAESPDLVGTLTAQVGGV